MSPAAALAWHQVRREARSKEGAMAAAALVLALLMVPLFAVPSLRGEPRLAALVLWAPLVFAGLATVARRPAADVDRGELDLVRMAPVPLRVHGAAVTATNAVLAVLVALACLTAGAGVFGLQATGPLVATMLLSATGLAIVGSLLGAIAAQARSRELLLPVLAVPVLVPVLQAGIGATLAALSGGGWGDVRAGLLLLGAYDAGAAAIAWLLWDHVLAGD